MPKVNFKASAQEFEPLPSDNYLCIVESAQLVQARSSGNMMIKVISVVTTNNEYNNRKLFDNFVLVPQSGWVLKNFLEAAQIPHTAIPGAGKGEFEIDCDTDDFIGAKYIAEVEQETYVVMQGGNVVIDSITGKAKSGIRNTTKAYYKA